MSKYNWNSFTKRVGVKAPEKNIYNAWATQEGLERWFLSKAEFTLPEGVLHNRKDYIQPGDAYSWNWHGYSDYVGTGEIFQTNERDFLQFTFTAGCVVDIHVKQEAGETVCELIQKMPQKSQEDRQYYYIERGKGWTFYLANLKSVLEGGLDLRNKNNDLINMVNA